MSYRIIVRIRASIFPNSGTPSVHVRFSGSAPEVMSTVSVVSPNLWAGTFASSWLSLDEDLYGRITQSRFSFPTASEASTADKAESTPPDNPTANLLYPTFCVSSLMKRTRRFLTSSN